MLTFEALGRSRRAFPAIGLAAVVAAVAGPSASAAVPTPPPTPTFLTTEHSDVFSAHDTPASSPITPQDAKGPEPVPEDRSQPVIDPPLPGIHDESAEDTRVRRQPLVLRRASLSQRAMKVTIACTDPGRLSVTMAGRRAEKLAARAFSCRDGQAKVTLKLSKKAFRRLIRRPSTGVVLVLRAAGATQRLPLVVHGRSGRVRARLAVAYEPKATSYCMGTGDVAIGGGSTVISYSQDATFGGNYGETLYSRPWVYWYQPSTGRADWYSGYSWNAWTIVRDPSEGAHWSSPSVFVIGGTAVPGTSYSASYRIPPGTWIYQGVQTWTASRGYDFTPVTPTAESPAWAAGTWCWFG